MSKKQLHSRLENLFSNLVEDEAASIDQPLVEPAVVSGNGSAPDARPDIPVRAIGQEQICGWTWEIDARKNYISCSAEVNSSLGIPPEKFVGQPIISFAIHSKSTPVIEQALSQPQYPHEANVFFKNGSQQWVPARIHVIKQNDLLSQGGWQGFTEILPSGEVPPEDEPAPPKEKRKPAQITVQSIEAEPKGQRKPSTTALQWMNEQQGYAIQNESILPATHIWTPAGEKSIENNEAIFENADEEHSATIAVPFQMQGIGDLLLEIVDESSDREWNEDDNILVMEIANQLSLALDNAQLFISAQQELAERVRAEEVTLRRNKDLSALNRIGQQLSRLATRAEIFDLLSKMISEVVGSENLYIATYNPVRQSLSFPVYYLNNEFVIIPDRPLYTDIPDYVIRTKSALLITENMSDSLLNKGIEPLSRIPLSLLAIPLIAGERVIGTVVVQDFEKEKAFDNIQLELLSTAAAQATTALENADLFQQMQSALEALETRERYQSNVAKAAATLTEFGTKSMGEVLLSLGSAAQCSRIYFAQLKADERGTYWTSTSEWADPSTAYLFDKNRISQILTSIYPKWVSDLREKGWSTTVTGEEHTPEADFLSSQHVRSILLLAVPGEAAIPSYLAFEQVGTSRVWHNEEINALRLAADAISNTFVRENLLDQLQVSLDETENLYKTANQLALANDMQEMVGAVLAGMRSPGINRAVLWLFENDRTGNQTQIRVGANWYSGRGTPPPPIGLEFPRSFYESLLKDQSPHFIEEVQEWPFDPELKKQILGQNIHGLAILPLLTGKRQTGALLIEAEDRHIFSGREIRTYPPLADQMAISVENQRLFEQTQKSLAETELLYDVSSRIAQSAGPEDMLSLVIETVMPTGAERAWLAFVNSDQNDELIEVEIAGAMDTHGQYQSMDDHLSVASLPIIRSLTEEPILITDLDTYSTDPASKQTLQQYHIQAACMVPLRTSGRLMGVLMASSSAPLRFVSDETRLLRIVGNGIAVSLEKQRLLRQAQRRALELQTASEIARDTTSTLSLDLLLNRIVNLLVERFNFYHDSIFLLDDTGSYAVIREFTGDAGREMKRRGHRLPVGSRSVVGMVTLTGEPYIINNTQTDPNHLPNPLLPDTLSEMGVPLKISNKVIGALDLQSRSINAFNQDDVAVLQILADQIAIAIENARAFELSQMAIADMKEVDRVKSQFLANISHELRTPLNSIIGFSRVILKGIDGPINDTQKQDLNAIYNSGQHLLRLINDILDLSKIEAGKMEMSFSDVNLVDMINSVMSTAVGLVKDKAVKLKTKIPENLPVVRADQTRIRQVLINFLSNAAKFTDEGEITVEALLTTSPQTNNPEVMLTVTDSGPGIAEQDQIKLFLPFSQVDDSPTRKTGGTGLGLSICRSLIDMHNGRIGLLRSEIGIGSTFFFTLPLSTPVPIPEVEPLNPLSNVILAIDDDQRVINLYERYLKPHGYQIIALNNPKEAVNRAKEVRPFAITLDIMMPEKDGWQVMQDLKNNADTRDIPIIICSILENQEKGFSMGAADYLVKPFLQEDLTNSMNRLNSDGQIINVLVIDDDPDALKLVKKIIEETQKYQVTLAQGGKAGWASIQAKRPDAIILDLFMPDLNGFAILGNLRETESLRNIPVIVLTGADLTPEQHKQLSEFGQGLLAKGFLREKELLLILEDALKKFRTAKKV